MVSQEQIEQKVQEYLRNSQSLADQWQRPITPEQLQAEMNRMANHTRHPEVLRELFAALANDPFIVAECLARPLLSEQLVNELHAGLNPLAETESLGSSTGTTETESPVTIEQPNSGYYLPEIASSPVADPAGACVENWTATSTTGAPDQRALPTAVWTGTEMIVWGGFGAHGDENTGRRYNPGTDRWTAMTTTGAPTGRSNHTAVWTDSEMIVWGGATDIEPNGTNTGGRYNPSTNSWAATSTNNAPDFRFGHTAVWTGTEMIVWGGYDNLHPPPKNTGGRYNPSTDSWVVTTTNNAPDGRFYHTAVWTGIEMIVWGGFGDLGDGGRYNLSTDSWVATTTTGAPAGRWAHAAVWTGSEMIVWGGYNRGDPGNTSGRYVPCTGN